MIFKNNRCFRQSILFVCLLISMFIQSQVSENRSMDAIVKQSVLPHLDDQIMKLESERLDFELNGVRTFDKPHNFLPGKSAIAF